jgi:small Trp-rich protein
MWLVGVGLLMLALKLLGLTFVADWPWWVVLAPFVAAAVWWKFADATGITQRAAMRREDERAARRREAQFASLGLRQRRDSAAKPPKPERPPRSES